MRNWKKVLGVVSAAAMAATMMMPASVFAAKNETFKIEVITHNTVPTYTTQQRSLQMRSTRTEDSTDIRLRSLTQVMTREIRRKQ